MEGGTLATAEALGASAVAEAQSARHWRPTRSLGHRRGLLISQLLKDGGPVEADGDAQFAQRKEGFEQISRAKHTKIQMTRTRS